MILGKPMGPDGRMAYAAPSYQVTSVKFPQSSMRRKVVSTHTIMNVFMHSAKIWLTRCGE